MPSSVLSLLAPKEASSPVAGNLANQANRPAPEQPFAPVLAAAVTLLQGGANSEGAGGSPALQLSQHKVAGNALQSMVQQSGALSPLQGAPTFNLSEAERAALTSHLSQLTPSAAAGRVAAFASDQGAAVMPALYFQTMQTSPALTAQMAQAKQTAQPVGAEPMTAPLSAEAVSSTVYAVLAAAQMQPVTDAAVSSEGLSGAMVTGLPAGGGQFFSRINDASADARAPVDGPDIEHSGLPLYGLTLTQLVTTSGYVAGFHPAATAGGEAMMLLAGQADSSGPNSSAGPASPAFQQMLAQLAGGDAPELPADLDGWVERLVSQMQQGTATPQANAAASSGAVSPFSADNGPGSAGGPTVFQLTSQTFMAAAPSPLLNPLASQAPGMLDAALRPDGQSADGWQLTVSGSTSAAHSASAQHSQDHPLYLVKSNATGAEAKNAASEQVQVTIRQAFRPGMDRVTIQLDPPDLGRVDVRIELNVDGRNQVIFSADNRDTLDLLQRDARQLERALQEAGIDADSSDMEFTLNQQSDGQDEHSEREAHADQAIGGPTGLSAETDAVIDPLTGRYTITLSDGVDIRV